MHFRNDSKNQSKTNFVQNSHFMPESGLKCHTFSEKNLLLARPGNRLRKTKFDPKHVKNTEEKESDSLKNLNWNWNLFRQHEFTVTNPTSVQS